jgi:hypothetical protein
MRSNQQQNLSRAASQSRSAALSKLSIAWPFLSANADSTLCPAVPNKSPCRCVSVPATDWALSSRVCPPLRRPRLPVLAGFTKSSAMVSAFWRDATLSACGSLPATEAISQGAFPLSECFEEDGAIVDREACKLGCESIVSKRLISPYRSGRSPHWVKVKNPKAPAVKREAEEDWGNKQWSRARRRASY